MSRSQLMLPAAEVSCSSQFRPSLEDLRYYFRTQTRFKGRYNIYSRMDIVSTIKKHVTDEEWLSLCDGCFGSVFQIGFWTYYGFARCWKRRGYKRLNGPPISISPSLGRRKRRCRIKIGPRIRRLGSPKKCLIRLKDAYIKMMMRFANAGFGANSPGAGFRSGPIKEYDRTMIVHIYKYID